MSQSPAAATLDFLAIQYSIYNHEFELNVNTCFNVNIMADGFERNPLLDKYCGAFSDELEVAPQLQAEAVLHDLLDSLQEVIPATETPHTSPILGTVNSADSDPVDFDFPIVPYPLPDKNPANLQLSISRPRVLRDLNIDARSWSTLQLSTDHAPFFTRPQPSSCNWTVIASLSKSGLDLKNERGLIRSGTIAELGQFASACLYIREYIEQH